MKQFACKIAQEGFYAGPVFCVQGVSIPVRETVEDVQAELQNWEAARANLQANTHIETNSEKNEEIRQTVLQILDDVAFTEPITAMIRNGQLTAAYAIYETAEELCGKLAKVPDPYIRSRQEDVRGVARKLLAYLEGIGEEPTERSVICAREIAPAWLASVDEHMIGALVSEIGSPISHAAIMAGNLGIPYLYGSEEALEALQTADWAVIDGEQGLVITELSDSEKILATARMDALRLEREQEEQRERDEAAFLVTCRTKIYANIGGPEDLNAVLTSGADGIGLFRTEFLFLNRNSAPTEEEQLEVYRKVLTAMGSKVVVIRTMDLGSDKQAAWLPLPIENNPALGLRGARISLARQDLFMQQLRALLRASVYGNLKVMFPMITSKWEIEEIQACMKEAENELQAEGTPYKIPDIGVMIETPAAAICADLLAPMVHFFSIGTNDLSQYTLALDREIEGLDRYYEPHHEAVYRLIELTAKAGATQGISTGVCGQLAADPEAIPRLIQAGVGELSVPASKVKSVRILVSKAEKTI